MPTDLETVQANGTLLTMTGVNLPPFSARGLTQTLDNISQASSLQRSINGDLIDFSAPQFRKYQSTITCTDMNTPLPDDLWPGAEVTVGCVSELHYDPGSGPEHDIVTGSERTYGGRTFYRPALNMVVISFTTSTDEWGASVGWQIDLEEV